MFKLWTRHYYNSAVYQILCQLGGCLVHLWGSVKYVIF
jgi:hypothetical protein